MFPTPKVQEGNQKPAKSHRKWILLGLGTVLVGGTVALLAGGSSSNDHAPGGIGFPPELPTH